jgi:hypothetical protein
MKTPRGWITMRRLMIGAAVVAATVAVTGSIHWLWLPLVEPTKAVDHGVSAKRRVILKGSGEFLSWNPQAQTLATTAATDFTDQNAILWDPTTGSGARTGRPLPPARTITW